MEKKEKPKKKKKKEGGNRWQPQIRFREGRKERGRRREKTIKTF